MVGRKKAAASTSAPKSTKQQSILALFPKKTTSAGVPQQPVPSAFDPVPQPLAVPINDDEPHSKVIYYVSSSPEPVPIASTSKTPLGSPSSPSLPSTTGPIDTTFNSETASLKLPSENVTPNKPPPSRLTAPIASTSNAETAPHAPSLTTTALNSRLLSSRSTKPTSKGASRPKDSVVIDLTLPSESPPPSVIQPKIPRPTYSIFNARPKLDVPVVPSTSQSTVPKQKYHRSNPKQSGPASLAKLATAVQEVDAPFPDRDWQHVRGPQTSFSAPTHWRRSSKTVINDLSEHFRPPMDVGEQPIKRTLSRVSSPSFWEKEKCIEDIPSEHKEAHPAIARLAASIISPPDAASSLEKLWSERWRPQRSDGVIGNEDNAVYLRDWLRALEVRFKKPPAADVGMNRRGKGLDDPRGAKRPQVMRSVARANKRQRRSSDGFIISDASDYSSEVEGPADTERDDDDDFRLSLPDDPAPEENATNLFGEHLANTIILCGPSGTGKTTAVYSCAEELGCEVFEVYPGIGKRNGASLETMIGEVGKNHLVRRTQVRGALSRSRDEEVDPDNSDDFGFVTQKLKTSIRQSVVLLEEVDILFKEDGSFWPAVIKFIKDCKRAVILTCNDLSLVPTSELPLQTILNFQPCPAPIVGSYLQGLCCAEGYIVDRNVLAQMYAQGEDLRHTIHRLQLLCQGFPLGERALDHLLDWNTASKQSVFHADLSSFVDAYMTRGFLDQPPALALTRYEHGADDETGFPILADALDDGYGIYEWDRRIMDAAMERARGTRVACAGDHGREYQELVDALKTNSAFTVGVFERAVAHTEYVPWVRHIIAGEDAAAETQSARWAGRGTRNSTRYYRSVELDCEGRGALLSSSLRL